mgnify:CR=1 FL=1
MSVAPFSYLNELQDEDFRALERMIDQAGLGYVVNALASIAEWQAQRCDVAADMPSAKRWRRASCILAKVGYAPGMKA